MRRKTKITMIATESAAETYERFLLQELFQDLQNEEAEVTVKYCVDNDSDISDYMI